MKRTKRAAALLLTLAMIFVLCSCKKDPPEITGTWVAEVDYTQTLNEQMASNFTNNSGVKVEPFEVETPCILTFTLELADNGYFRITTDPEKTAEAYKAYLLSAKEAMKPALVEAVYAAAAQKGYSRAQADQAYISRYGQSIENYCVSAIDKAYSEENIDAVNVGSDSVGQGFYKYEDGKLMLGDQDMQFSPDRYIGVDLDYDTLTFLSSNNITGLSLRGHLPMVFTRQTDK